MHSPKNHITLYTDGASRGNPGLAGWAALVLRDHDVVELAGAKASATNNQMELEAVIQGLSYIQKHMPEASVSLHADSRYVLSGLEKWLDGWVKKGWVTMAKKPIENRAQWETLLMLRDHFGARLKFVKVNGHSGHLYNDRCDELAVAAALNKKHKLFIGTMDDYKTFLESNPPRSAAKKSSAQTSSEPAYSYVSLVNGKVHADPDWVTCSKRVTGAKGAKYKKVFSKAEETELLQDYTLQALL